MSTFPVRFVSFRTWRSSSNNSMSSQRSPPDVDEEDFSELGTSGASVVTCPTSASSSAKKPSLRSVWDFEKIERRGGPDQKTRMWHCGWCGLTLKGWNATKALAHVTRAAGNNDVKPCRGTIPKATLALFQTYRYQQKVQSKTKRIHQEVFSDSISENQKRISVMFAGARTRNSNSCAANTAIDLTSEPSDGGVHTSNAARLTSAIAEFVYSKGLPFSSIEGEHFLQILRLTRLVPNSYRPPTRKVIANDLLQITYERKLQKYMNDLEIDSDVYGLSLFGDGATVHGMPLMNILAAGVGEPCAVLAIVNCKLFFLFCFFLNGALTLCC